MARRRPPRPTSVPVEPEPGRQALTYQQAAYLLGVSVSTVYKMVRAGRLPKVKIASATRIPRKAIDDFLDARDDDDRVEVG